MTNAYPAFDQTHKGHLFQTLIERASAAMALFSGPDFVIVWANDSALAYWDRTSEQVLNKPLFAALPEASGQGYEALLRDVYTTGKRFVAKELPINLVRNGQLERTYIDFVYEPFYQTESTITGVTVICTEVTEQVIARQKMEESQEQYRLLFTELDYQVQQRTEELETVNEELAANNEELATNNEEYLSVNQELEEANRLLIRSNANLQQFAYVASHDLQEPLRKIQQFGDLLQNQYANQLGEGIDHLRRMQGAASRMSVLIRDLLTFSRISTQRDTSPRLRLREIVEEAVSDVEMRIQETGAVVKIEPLPIVAGDPSQLGQLFQNLLSNALKFRQTDPAGVPLKPIIQINARRVAAEDLPPSVKPARAVEAYYRIDVADNGIGFDEKYLDRIFQVFQRLHGKSEFAGTGIGLAICEKVATNHGGAITATSQPGRGATFSVYLPV